EQSELQPILEWIVRRSVQLLGVDECSIKIIVDEGPVRTVGLGQSPRLEAGAASWPRALKDTVMGFLHTQSTELATRGLIVDPGFPSLHSTESPARALLAVPLKVEGRITGMLAVSNRVPGRAWSRQDGQLLSIVASHSASVIEKARLRVEAEKKQKLELE